MLPSLPLDITGPASPYLLLVLGFLALLVVDLLIALIEGVTLTLLSWNPFRASLSDCLEQIEGAERVDLEVLARIVDRRRDCNLSR